MHFDVATVLQFPAPSQMKDFQNLNEANSDVAFKGLQGLSLAVLII